VSGLLSIKLTRLAGWVNTRQPCSLSPIIDGSSFQPCHQEATTPAGNTENIDNDMNVMKNMEKKGRGGGVRVTGKSPIATPPRVAVQGRSKADHHDDSASTKSAPDGNGSDNEESESDVKDKKIIHLEKELATMEDEFERELTQLSHKLTNESETAIFWQQKHSALNQTYLKADTDLRLLRQEVNSFQQDRDQRDRDIKTRISSLIMDRDAFREAYNEACGDLKSKDDLIKSLQIDVRGLKNFVSTNSKMDEQIADEIFGEQMQRLGNSIQNWVITNFRRAKIGKFQYVYNTSWYILVLFL